VHQPDRVSFQVSTSSSPPGRQVSAEAGPRRSVFAVGFPQRSFLCMKHDSLPTALPIAPVDRPIVGRVRPPGSKSITNRAVICAALARGTSRLTGVLDSDDTRVMVAGLDQLGVSIEADWPAHRLTVTGTAGDIPAAAAVIDCRASGTTMRFLAAVCSLGRGRFVLDGTPRMRQRPIGDLLAALRSLGIEAAAGSPGECPPVEIRADGIKAAAATIAGNTSSQFASGLALAAPCMPDGLELELAGRLVSAPYLTLTRRVLEAFGGRCDVVGSRRWMIAATGYTACDYSIEPDASAASYFAAAAAITGGRVELIGLGRESLQGDLEFCRLLEQMGCQLAWADEAGREPAVTVTGGSLRGIDVDMNAISDTVMTLAAVALFAEGPTTIRNVAHIRDKETDRIADLTRELRRLGAGVEERPDGLTITPAPLQPAAIKTYDDHRMAMSLALVGLASPGVTILDPACVSKTFPHYWTVLETLASGPAVPRAGDSGSPG